MRMSVEDPIYPFHSACILDDKIVLAVVDKHRHSVGKKKLHSIDLVGHEVSIHILINVICMTIIHDSRV